MRAYAPNDPKQPKSAREFAERDRSDADVIIEGTVLTQTIEFGQREVSVVVNRSYQGGVKGLITVTTEALGPGDCSYDFETGHRYLIYAIHDGLFFFTDICTPTKPIEAASAAELHVLRGEPPAPDDLLDPQTYYKRHAPKWTGQLCGHVTKPDGKPLRATLWVTQIRDEPFLPKAGVFGSDRMEPDGSFCIGGIRPGKYLLNGEYIDWNKNVRWSGCYPVGGLNSEASAIEIKAGSTVSDITLQVQQQPLDRSQVEKDPCSELLPDASEKHLQ